MSLGFAEEWVQKAENCPVFVGQFEMGERWKIGSLEPRSGSGSRGFCPGLNIGPFYAAITDLSSTASLVNE